MKSRLIHKISCICTNKHWAVQKWIQKTFHNSIKKSKMLRSGFNKINTKLAHWKVQNWKKYEESEWIGNFPCPWAGRLSTTGMVILSKLVCRFNAIFVKVPAALFWEGPIVKLIIKFLWKCKWPRIAKTVPKRKKKIGRLLFPNFRTYCKSIVINQNSVILAKDRSRVQK